MFVTTPKFIQALFPSLIWRKETLDKNIWLTFDDGPSPHVTSWILSILKKENIKATFFLIGQKIEEFPELVGAIVKDGHTIANHSYSHKNGWLTNKEKYLEDIERCQALMPNNKLFRPPYGKITKAQIAVLKEKYKIILWDVLSYDFKQNTNPKIVQENIIKNTSAGSIIVMHNNQMSFKNLQPILEKTIQQLKIEGYNFSATW
ncbi:MAG: Peptidoglycan-N-acetylglucosamine deacetylase [Cryomorphaceae bacterium]|nr:MAG: Peptidoglycan-N-acetylglucosamine deacetylase [Cryomorphaceae bacterium]